MDKILTIIIPTYNMEKYLRKCLDSLIVSDENMERLEVLVVNDGSKDSSSQIGHEYESKYPQTFRVIDKENGNYGSCINRGLKEATGKYVKVLDADDYYTNDVFNSYISFLQDVNTDLVINDFRIVDENDKETETYTFDLPLDREFTLSDIPDGMNTWLWHQSLAYKTEIFSHIEYHQTEGVSYSDDEFVFVPMIEVRRIVCFPHTFYNYLLGREGQTFDHNVMVRSFNQHIVIGKSMVTSFEKEKDRCSKESRHFMEMKLKMRIGVIYNFYLTKAFNTDGNKILAEFDHFIKQTSPVAYRLLESEDKYGHDNFIKVWRAANYHNTIYLWLRQTKFKLQLMLGKPYRNLHMPDDLRRK